MATKKTYTVQYERDEDGWWMASIKEASGVRTQGRSIGEARTRVREALAAAVGESIASEAVLVDDIGIPSKLKKAIVALKKAQRIAKEQQDLAAELARETA